MNEKMNRNSVIDSHIHLDMYSESEQKNILSDCRLDNILGLISVSFHLKSCRENLRLSKQDARVKAAFGYHPEQPVPTDEELSGILAFMKENRSFMIAVGEVGLPYYLRKEEPALDVVPYVELLKIFIKQAKIFEKPVILHAVYEDADIAIDLLEETSIEKAHFHWFKGSSSALQRMQENGYYISITPDLLYEQEIEGIVRQYPLGLLLVETDGPWRFDGPFAGEMTHPKMIHKTIEKIADIKNQSVEDVYQTILGNTKQLYSI